MSRYHPYSSYSAKPDPYAILRDPGPNRRPTPKCPPWATPAQTRITNADGSTVESILEIQEYGGRYDALWSQEPQMVNVRDDDPVAGTMRIFARMSGVTLTSRGNPFWFENLDGDALDEPTAHDILCAGGIARVVMKTSNYKPPPKASPTIAPPALAPAPASAPKAKSKATSTAATKATTKTASKVTPAKTTSGSTKTTTLGKSEGAIIGEMHISDVRDKCRVSWSHTNRELVVPWTDSAESVMRIFAFMMSYKVAKAKTAIQFETKSGIRLNDPTMRQAMDGGKMVKVSLKQATS